MAIVVSIKSNLDEVKADMAKVVAFDSQVTRDQIAYLGRLMQLVRNDVRSNRINKPATGNRWVRVPGRKTVKRRSSGAPHPPEVLSVLTRRLMTGISSYSGFYEKKPTGVIGTNVAEGVIWEKRQAGDVVNVKPHMRTSRKFIGRRRKSTGKGMMNECSTSQHKVDGYFWTVSGVTKDGTEKGPRQFLWPAMLAFQEKAAEQLAKLTHAGYRTPARFTYNPGRAA